MDDDLPYLNLLCEITSLEPSGLYYVREAVVDDLSVTHEQGRASPMISSNAIALLFEAAIEDVKDRPYLMDLAEAIYYEDTPPSVSEVGVGPDYDDFDEDDDEPVPLYGASNVDPLMSFWQRHSQLDSREPSTRPTTKVEARRKKKARRANTPLKSLNLSRPSTVATERHRPLPDIARKSLDARRSLERAKQEKEFWANRLKMLHRELDKAQAKVDIARTKDTKFEVSTVVNETVSAQLAEERSRDYALRQEKAQSIRAHKAAHRQAVRQAQSQIIQNKIEAGRLMKVHQRNHQAIVESLRKQEFEEKCQRRSEVQQSKVVAMLKRVREQAMRQEEIKRNYSLRVEHVKDEERRCHEISLQSVEQSSKLVAKIRQLRQLESQSASSRFALRSLDTTMYSPNTQ